MMVNVSHELTLTRRGITLEINIDPGRKYKIRANGKGSQIVRTLPNGEETCYVDFNSFLYPDDIQENEKDLIEMLTPQFDNGDRDMIELSELMVIHQQAGTPEGEIDDLIRTFTKRFEEG